MTEALYGQAVGWLDRNVSHILPDDGSYGIDHILEKARQVVRRKGVRILVIDPMNRLEQRLEPGQTEMDYITDTLNKLGRFATRNQCLVILVAHPRKVNRNEKDGTLRRVEMNDINGSANFANMSDFCLVVDRNDTKQIATIYIEKVRFKHLGSAHTEAKFVYNPQGERPGPVNTQFDNENWLKIMKNKAGYSNKIRIFTRQKKRIRASMCKLCNHRLSVQSCVIRIKENI